MPKNASSNKFIDINTQSISSSKEQIQLLSNVIGQYSFLMINKSLARMFGIDVAILLAHLIYKMNYWYEKTGDIEFYCIQNDIQKETTLSEYRQRKAVNILVKNEILKIRYAGLPKKAYYSLMIPQLLRKLTTCSKESEPQEVKKVNTS